MASLRNRLVTMRLSINSTMLYGMYARRPKPHVKKMIGPQTNILMFTPAECPTRPLKGTRIPLKADNVPMSREIKTLLPLAAAQYNRSTSSKPVSQADFPIGSESSLTNQEIGKNKQLGLGVAEPKRVFVEAGGEPVLFCRS